MPCDVARSSHRSGKTTSPRYRGQDQEDHPRVWVTRPRSLIGFSCKAIGVSDALGRTRMERYLSNQRTRHVFLKSPVSFCNAHSLNKYSNLHGIFSIVRRACPLNRPVALWMLPCASTHDHHLATVILHAGSKPTRLVTRIGVPFQLTPSTTCYHRMSTMPTQITMVINTDNHR